MDLGVAAVAGAVTAPPRGKSCLPRSLSRAFCGAHLASSRVSTERLRPSALLSVVGFYAKSDVRSSLNDPFLTKKAGIRVRWSSLDYILDANCFAQPWEILGVCKDVEGVCSNASSILY